MHLFRTGPELQLQAALSLKSFLRGKALPSGGRKWKKSSAWDKIRSDVYVYCRKNKFTYFCRLYEKECSMDRKTLTDEVFPDCPIRNILARISDKWSLLVIYTLYESGKDNMRFKELQRDIPDISQKMLTVTLRTLETDGYVTRTVYPEVPPHVEYSLTDRAHSLLPHVNALIDWASEHRDEIMEDRRKASGGGQ